MTWEEIGIAISAVTADRQSVEVGMCGPHYNNGRQPGVDYFASLLEYAGSCRCTRYGATPRDALSKLLSPGREDVSYT